MLLGYDLGSSSIKATLIKSDTGKVVTSATYPKQEMQIISKKPEFAEQDPEMWWDNVQSVTKELLIKSRIPKEAIKAIGISYQMHGLVLVDKNHNVLRPSIIWCDSRAVDIGKKAFHDLGGEFCLSNYLNSPGNFTASKLKWVKDNEPEIFEKTYKAMLPGDYLAMKMTGNINTTVSGLSEGIFWDFKSKKIADKLLAYYGIDKKLLPDIVDTFSDQGELSKSAAENLGLVPGIKISYRAGDQPNNAFSLNVLNAGEAAATAGTSGVVYGIIETPEYDDLSRVNTFVHVNHSKKNERYGVLLCVNGTGILNSWLQKNMVNGMSYEEMNEIKEGKCGNTFLPFSKLLSRKLLRLNYSLNTKRT